MQEFCFFRIAECTSSVIMLCFLLLLLLMHEDVHVLVFMSMQGLQHLLLLQMDVLWHAWVLLLQEGPVQE